jgi:hypothetical protein
MLDELSATLAMAHAPAPGPSAPPRAPPQPTIARVVGAVAKRYGLAVDDLTARARVVSEQKDMARKVAIYLCLRLPTVPTNAEVGAAFGLSPRSIGRPQTEIGKRVRRDRALRAMLSELAVEIGIPVKTVLAPAKPGVRKDYLR